MKTLTADELRKRLERAEELLRDHVFHTGDGDGENTPMPVCIYCGKADWGASEHYPGCDYMEFMKEEE